MSQVKNERGAVLVFVTLIIVLLLIMVGMGLDTGHLAYIRSQGQPAVDAAALAAASAIPTNDPTEVNNRAAAFNSTNTYLNSSGNPISASNVTLVNYNPATGAIVPATGVTTSPPSTGNANGARVALEATNPYGGSVGAPMKSPLFLTPLFNLFGQTVKTTADVSVSAVAVIRASPDLPIAMEEGQCAGPNPTKLLQSNKNTDTSGYTTYHINNASKTQINNLLDAGLTCSGGIPAVGYNFCTELNNGQITSLYNEFENAFKIDQTRCYLIPVVKTGTSFNQCSPILDFAKFCPIQGDDGFGLGKTKSEDGQGWDRYIYGNITCGQNPFNIPEVKCQIPTLVRDKASGM